MSSVETLDSSMKRNCITSRSSLSSKSNIMKEEYPTFCLFKETPASNDKGAELPSITDLIDELLSKDNNNEESLTSRVCPPKQQGRKIEQIEATSPSLLMPSWKLPRNLVIPSLEEQEETIHEQQQQQQQDDMEQAQKQVVHSRKTRPSVRLAPASRCQKQKTRICHSLLLLPEDDQVQQRYCQQQHHFDPDEKSLSMLECFEHKNKKP